MNQIKLDRKQFIKQLATVKDDNISIADVVIDRRKLVEALRLQTQPDADILTLTYGKLAWQSENGDYQVDHEPSIQFSCNHTTMRFLNRPKHPKNNSRYTPTIKALNFTDHQTEQPRQEFTGIPVDTEELLTALNFVIHGVAIEETRPVLNCVCFNCSKDKIELVTADGFRLPVTIVYSKGMTNKQALIHRCDIPKLVTFLKNNVTGKGKSKGWLSTYVDIRESKTQFMSDKGKVEFDNQTGSYPDYTRLIPNEGYTHIELIASQMLEAVKALKHIADDGSGIIRLQFVKGYPIGTLTLAAKSEDYGESSTECDAKVDQDYKIAVNAKYLADVLGTCGDRVIDLFVQSPSHPIVFCDDTRLEVIMPMFVQW